MIKRISSTAIARVDNDTTTITVSHSGGSCDCVMAYVGNEGDVVTGVTYAGVAMTKITNIVYAGAGAVETDTIWGLKDAPSGTQNLVITKPLLTNNRTTCGIVSYAGVSRTATFPDASNTNQVINPGPASLTVSVTTTVENCALVGMAFFTGSASDEISPSTNTVEISSLKVVGRSHWTLESTSLNNGAAGSKSLAISCGSLNQNFMLSVVALAPNPFYSVSSPMII